jgi:hypothetical protein
MNITMIKNLTIKLWQNHVWEFFSVRLGKLTTAEVCYNGAGVDDIDVEVFYSRVLVLFFKNHENTIGLLV